MANDLWRTPPQVFEHYNSIFNFKCDVAASKENSLCEKYITEEEDTLTLPWREKLIIPGEYVWLNCPYSKPLPFIRKAIVESSFYGIGSVILTNLDMSVEWSAVLSNIGCEIEQFTASGSKEDKTYCNGRMAFLDSNGEPIGSNNKGQMVSIIPPFVSVNRKALITTTPLKEIMESGQSVIEHKLKVNKNLHQDNYNLAA